MGQTRNPPVGPAGTTSAYIFGAICLEKAKPAALVLPYANIEAMQMHVDKISLAVLKCGHAIFVADQAGWHTTDKLIVPANLALLHLPPDLRN